MLFYDMIPKAHKEHNRLPTFGSVLGFIVGFALQHCSALTFISSAASIDP